MVSLVQNFEIVPFEEKKKKKQTFCYCYSLILMWKNIKCFKTQKTPFININKNIKSGIEIANVIFFT